MARYRVRYADYAAEQLSQLPRPMRTVFDARIADLKRAPDVVGDYDTRTGSFSTAFGETGIILYVFSDKIDMVTIFRVTWLE